MAKKMKLYGFNNLTKTLSFNIFDICYTRDNEEQSAYKAYIDEQFNAERVTNILKNVTEMIGAYVLNIAKQDYDPEGASVTIMISEENIPKRCLDSSCNAGVIPPTDVVAHLNKSHVTVHTYPESHPRKGVSSFRADIDVSSCGTISPLKSLKYLIESFDSDIISIDYRVRGFTRDLKGKKFYIDHKISSIQDYIPKEVKNKYEMIDVNVYQENIFHTKMLLKDFVLDEYLFEITGDDLALREKNKIVKEIKKEMYEIFYSKNF